MGNDRFAKFFAALWRGFVSVSHRAVDMPWAVDGRPNEFVSSPRWSICPLASTSPSWSRNSATSAKIRRHARVSLRSAWEDLAIPRRLLRQWDGWPVVRCSGHTSPLRSVTPKCDSAAKPDLKDRARSMPPHWPRRMSPVNVIRSRIYGRLCSNYTSNSLWPNRWVLA